MYLRSRFGLALAVILAVMLGAGGCAQKSAKAKLPKNVHITSKVTWPGEDLGTNRLVLTLSPVPKPPDGSGDIVIPYELPQLPSAQAAQEGKLVNSVTFSATIKTDGEEAIIAKLAPPSGWKVTPKEYRVIKDNKHVDFKLEKIKQ
jgi:hypothetical protein